jgi:transcription elongation GreA/GreB family factor
VQLGVQVRLRYLEEQRELALYIAGYDDGDPHAGRISYTAPLAARLLGAAPGDVLTVREAGRTREIEVAAVLPAPKEEQP